QRGPDRVQRGDPAAGREGHLDPGRMHVVVPRQPRQEPYDLAEVHLSVLVGDPQGRGPRLRVGAGRMSERQDDYDIPAGPKVSPGRMTWKFLRDRAGTIPAFHREFGDTFTLRILPGPRTLVVFSDP